MMMGIRIRTESSSICKRPFIYQGPRPLLRKRQLTSLFVIFWRPDASRGQTRSDSWRSFCLSPLWGRRSKLRSIYCSTHCERVACELWISLQVLLGFTKSTQVNRKLASKLPYKLASNLPNNLPSKRVNRGDESENAASLSIVRELEGSGIVFLFEPLNHCLQLILRLCRNPHRIPLN